MTAEPAGDRTLSTADAPGDRAASAAEPTGVDRRPTGYDGARLDPGQSNGHGGVRLDGDRPADAGRPDDAGRSPS
ncbi:hypothetical protein, partial [Micromonospora sp. CV4]|uniref:hypothetical protein n=1 Tax=Micromonospora sp. CV4 TaxID=2478711 RepID=UPI000F1EC053